jgi:hypothetical protein
LDGERIFFKVFFRRFSFCLASFSGFQRHKKHDILISSGGGGVVGHVVYCRIGSGSFIVTAGCVVDGLAEQAGWMAWKRGKIESEIDRNGQIEKSPFREKKLAKSSFIYIVI